MGEGSPAGRWRVTLLAGAALTSIVAGCSSGGVPGPTPIPARPEPGPTRTPAPTVRTTTSPAPAATGIPRDPRGIPALHQAGAYAVQVQQAVEAEIDRREPRSQHVVNCRPVPMMHLPGASTVCDIVTDGLPTTWTALVVPGTAPDGGLVVEISEGIRTDLPPFPPPG